MYRGRYQLGQKVPLTLWVRDSNSTPAVPDASPIAAVWSDTALVVTTILPVRDRYRLAGLFHVNLPLDGRFSPGRYRVDYQFRIGGIAHSGADEFEVDDGGNADGVGISLYSFRRPVGDYVVVQESAGRVLRRRNPRL